MIKEDKSSRDTKLRRTQAQQTESRTAQDKTNFIKDWLDDSSWSRIASTEDETQLSDESVNISNKFPPILPSHANSFESSTSASRSSEKSFASVHDTDYRISLSCHNIHINRDDPPLELMKRAKRIIYRSRASPEMDDTTAEALTATTRRLESEVEDVIIQQLAPSIIPAMRIIPDSRLASNAKQPWFNSVPVALKCSILDNPLPLPTPKPDLTFGYSDTAFTENQLGTIDLLIDDQYGRSLVVPDQKIRFPFLDIEFKSQAKNGTHYVATNQVAGAGAIALNGNMELMQRSFGAGSFDYNEPQFFSVTMDHQLACVNVHWLKAPAGGGHHSFHVEGLSQHLLKDPDGIRAVSRAIKNILDHGTGGRLRTLCVALDAYRETVVRNRELANAQTRQNNDLPEPQTERRRAKRMLPSDPRVGGGPSYEKEDGIHRRSHEAAAPLQTQRRPRRTPTTVREEEPSRSNLETGHASVRRAPKAVEYD